jgi:hypothetical protein
MQAAGSETIFSEHLNQYLVDPLQTFSSETVFPITASEQQERKEVLLSIRSALDRLISAISPAGRDRRYLDDLGSYMETLRRSTLPQTPKEQFDILYHFRKLLLWAPVSLLCSGRLEISTLIVLSYLYASALALEPVFPDIGAVFLGSQAVNPLTQCILRAQAYRDSKEFQASSQMIEMLMEFPRNALDQYQRRREWAQRDSSLQLPRPFDLANLPLDLGTPVGDQYSYTPSLSPAFPSSNMQLATPTTTHLPSAGSFLTVPSTGVDHYSFGAYTSAGASYQHTSTAGYVESPSLVSPGFANPLDAEATFHMTHAQYSPSLISTAEGGSMVNAAGVPPTFGMYPLQQANSMDFGHSGGVGVAGGGCVAPVAIWT